METPPICGVTCHAGAKGEPLACAFPHGHRGAHAWATLPTFVPEASPLARIDDLSWPTR